MQAPTAPTDVTTARSDFVALLDREVRERPRPTDGELLLQVCAILGENIDDFFGKHKSAALGLPAVRGKGFTESLHRAECKRIKGLVIEARGAVPMVDHREARFKAEAKHRQLRRELTREQTLLHQAIAANAHMDDMRARYFWLPDYERILDGELAESKKPKPVKKAKA